MARILKPILTFKDQACFAVFGVGLMGRAIAQAALESTYTRKLLLVDVAPDLNIDGTKIPLTDYAQTLNNPDGAEIVTAVGDISSEVAMKGLFDLHKGIDYLAITSGISPNGLTAPEMTSLEDYAKTLNVNSLGPINIVNQAVRCGALSKRSKGIVVLSTSAVHGSQGRANSGYEISKGALLNWLKLQARHYLESYGLVLNGFSPSPLIGPMATGTEVGKRRVADVVANTPLALTNPRHIVMQTFGYLAEECNSVGQDITICGGYTLHQPIYGDLPKDRMPVSQ